jgi:hypothetical protein
LLIGVGLATLALATRSTLLSNHEEESLVVVEPLLLRTDRERAYGLQLNITGF